MRNAGAEASAFLCLSIVLIRLGGTRIGDGPAKAHGDRDRSTSVDT